MASISAMIVLSVILIISCFSSYSCAISKDLSLTAPLIHRSSPESPFYDPNAKPLDILKASMRTSAARAIAFSNLNSNNNFSGSIKVPVPRFDIVNNDYVIRYEIGSPPMETYGAADTGSGLTWLQCKGCSSKCYDQHIKLFDPSKSVTYKAVQRESEECKKAAHSDLSPGKSKCHYKITYSDQSGSKGVIATETFTFPDTGTATKISHENIIFGCGLDNEDIPHRPKGEKGSPGVVGLSNHRSSLVGQLGFRHFSYCVPADPSFNGQIRFGSAAKISGLATKLEVHNHNDKVPDHIEGLYYIRNVDGLYVDDEKVEGIPEKVFKFVKGTQRRDPKGGLLIDTGASYTMFPSEAFTPLVNKLKQKMKTRGMEPITDKTKTFELCYDKKYRYTGNLPAIEIKFKDTNGSLKLIENNAWKEMPEYSYVCLALDKTPGKSSSLGMYQMRDLNVGIDLERLQVSFKPNPKCPEYQSVLLRDS